jgi:hypothetical protein
MKSLHETADRDLFLARLGRLTPDSRPLWGRMSAGKMLCHLGDSLSMALGDLKVAARGNRAFQVFPLKHFVLYVMPFPKGVPTAPELLSTQPAEFEQDRQRVKELTTRFATAGKMGTGPEHPLFGVLDGTEWGALLHRHFDHHLRQFGV